MEKELTIREQRILAKEHCMKTLQAYMELENHDPKEWKSLFDEYHRHRIELLELKGEIPTMKKKPRKPTRE